MIGGQLAPVPKLFVICGPFVTSKTSDQHFEVPILYFLFGCSILRMEEFPLGEGGIHLDSNAERLKNESNNNNVRKTALKLT